MKIRTVFMLLLVLAPAFVCANAEEESGCTVTVGIPIDMIVLHMDEFYHEHFAPYKSIGERLPCELKLEIFQQCGDLIDAMESGDVDLGGGRVSCYLRARHRLGAEPVFSVSIEDRKAHRGALLVRKDSPYKTVADLKGARFSTVNSESLVYHFFPWKFIWETQGIKLNSFFGEMIKCPTIISAVYSVTMGQSDVVMADEEFIEMKYTRGKLRALEYTFEIPYPLLFTAGEVEERVKQTADVIVEKLQEIPIEARVGSAFGLKTGITETADPDFTEFTKFLDEQGFLEKILAKDGKDAPAKKPGRPN